MTVSVVPKIANPRNHQGANTDANTREFIYKLQLGSKCAPQGGAGTGTPGWVPAGVLWAGLGDFQKGQKNFFIPIWGKGWGSILSSVFIPIWDFLSRAFGQGHSAVFPVTEVG